MHSGSVKTQRAESTPPLYRSTKKPTLIRVKILREKVINFHGVIVFTNQLNILIFNSFTYYGAAVSEFIRDNNDLKTSN